MRDISTKFSTYGVATALVAGTFLGSFTDTARATILFEDTMYWRPNGTTEINPPIPPVDAYVKIQETVYDDVQGRQVLQQQIDLNLIHGNGGVIPAGALNLYAYSITNLNYGNGPFTGGGLGITGYHIQNLIGPGYTMYGPNAANDNWAEDTSAPNSFGWDIDDNGNRIVGDGTGIVLGQTHNSFYVVVPAATIHGFGSAEIHTFIGGGGRPGDGAGVTQEIDRIFGIVSMPIPEPSISGALICVVAATAHRRVRRPD